MQHRSIQRKVQRSAVMRAMPGKTWGTRLSVLFLVTFSFTLLVLGRVNHPFVAQLRSVATDVMMPALSAISRPVDTVRGAGNWVSEMAALREANARLTAENAQLRQWQSAAHEMKAENDALRQLIRVVPAGKSTYIAARIVSETKGPYLRSALLSAGTVDGIKKDQAVIGPDGLVGRIVEAGLTSSRVLLIMDINSRVPVMGENSREKTMLAGNNSDGLSLEYVETGSKLEVGERVVTSGDGGIFPPGIPVGVISAISGKTVTVQAFADWSRLETVSAVDFQF